ncbi:MAG: DUF1002 domain-containing protein [Lachnospiraceae bacterium]|nr:DUF1002 domain-containing protein [Lachnospiraceae bacterium]
MRKRLLAVALCLMLVMQPLTAKADNATVVTIGVDLTDSQEQLMYEYFGVNKNQVAVIEVNNQDERKYLEGIAPDSQIGRKTFSCAYIEPTEAGKGINVKVANLNWVTSYMIATTLTTAGIYDCNVVVASPFIVSGTGALTGIMMAFESVTGTELEEEKKEVASEELVLNGNLGQQIGNDEATIIITEVKDTIIGENIVNAEQIEQVIIDKSTQYNISLTDEQVSMILGTMEKISTLEYDYEAIKSTLSKIGESAAEKLGFTTESDAEGADDETEAQNFFAKVVQKVKDFFKSIGEWFKNLFTGNSAKEDAAEEEGSTEENTDLGILQNTNDALLGEGAIIDATDESVITQPETDNSEEATENTENSAGSEETDTTEGGNGTLDNSNADSTEGENTGAEDVTTEEESAENAGTESETSDSQNGSLSGTETGSEVQEQSTGIVIQQESSDSYQTEDLTGNAQ